MQVCRNKGNQGFPYQPFLLGSVKLLNIDNSLNPCGYAGIKETKVSLINPSFYDVATRHAGMPEWSNGLDLRSSGLVPAKVRFLLPAFTINEKLFIQVIFIIL